MAVILEHMPREESALYPEQAAQLWPKLGAAAQKLGLRLGSPAAAPCGANCVVRNPFEWWTPPAPCAFVFPC